MKQAFSTGQIVPESGIYRVIHGGHRLPHEVTLLAGQAFPRCAKCKDAVHFEVVRYAPQMNSGQGFKIIVYELPVLDEENLSEVLA